MMIMMKKLFNDLNFVFYHIYWISHNFLLLISANHIFCYDCFKLG